MICPATGSSHGPLGSVARTGSIRMPARSSKKIAAQYRQLFRMAAGFPILFIRALTAIDLPGLREASPAALGSHNTAASRWSPSPSMRWSFDSENHVFHFRWFEKAHPTNRLVRTDFTEMEFDPDRHSDHRILFMLA